MRVATGFLLLCLAPHSVLAGDPPASPTADATYTFALAKMLADEGSFRDALQAFEEAVKLAPDDPFMHAEYAEFLVHLAQLARAPLYRQQHLRQAVEQAEAARRLAPENPEILRIAAQTYLTQAEFDPSNTAALNQARETFEEVRRMMPGEISVRLSLAQIYAYQDQPQAAADLYREVLDLSPGNGRVYQLLVEALLRANRQDQAIEVLQELLVEDPTSSPERLQLAELQAQAGHPAQAVATIEAGDEELRTRPEVQRFMAFQLYLAGRLEASLEALDAALAHEPEPVLRRLRAVVLAGLGRNQEAEAQLRELQAEEPDDVEIAATLSQVLVRQGEAAEAATVLRQLVDRLEASDAAPSARPVRLQLVELYLDQSAWQDALDVLQPLLATTEPAADERLGVVLLASEALMQLGRGDEALELLAGSHADAPANVAKRAEVLLRMGREAEGDALIAELTAGGDEGSVVPAVLVYQRLERREKVIALLEQLRARQAQKQGAVSANVLFMLGATYEQADRWSDAEATFRQLLAAEPDNKEALNYLGYMWADRGEHLEEALDMIQRALVQEPDSGAYVDSLGWVYYRLGRFEEAREQLERAVRLTPGDATVLEHLGDVYLALERRDEAREVYRQALAAGGDNADQLREKLRTLGDS